MKTLLASAFAFSLLITPAFTSPASGMAQAHIDAIEKGDVAAITSAFCEDATLH